MLIPCPECERQVSDRAKACPDCGFPVAEHVVELRAAADRAARLATRERVGEIDCPRCEARGFVQFETTDEHGVSREVFAWCSDCKHSGRVHQCRDRDGYYAIALVLLEQFLLGEIDVGDVGVSFVGALQVSEHRYQKPGDVHGDTDSSGSSGSSDGAT